MKRLDTHETQVSTDDAATSRRIAVFLSFSGQGGVEPMALNLVEQLAEDGVPVDLVTIKGHAVQRQLSDRVCHIDLGLRHSTLAPPALARYLRARQPHAVLAAKERGIRSAVIARKLAGVPTRLIGWVHSNMSEGLARRNSLSRWLHYQSIRRSFPALELVVGVSDGVAEDVREISGLSREKVAVVPNPAVTAKIIEMSHEPVAHPWFFDDGPPTILSAGRLTRQKDFPTLIRAFAILRSHMPCRLVIIGDGGERAALESLAKQLGVSDSVSLPGYAKNPYCYMANAQVFALSSAWEGFGAVLAEAMALGTPVVATDCPSGPAEILEHGQHGPLVPVGDHKALAAAIARVLQNPPASEQLIEAAQRYTARNCAAAFMPLLLGRADT